MTESFDPIPPDSVDWRILEQLQRDASLSNQDLAAKVHVRSSYVTRLELQPWAKLTARP